MVKRGRPPKNDLESSHEETEEELEEEADQPVDEEVEEVDEEAKLLDKLNRIRKKKEEQRFRQDVPILIKSLTEKINKIVDNQLKMYEILQEHHQQIQNLLNKSMAIQK